MSPTVIPALLSVVAATLSDQGEVISSKGDTIEGFSDEDIFLLIWGDANVFGPMLFADALASDPRRIEARIQQSLLQVFKKSLQYRMDDSTWKDISRRAYIERNARIRKANGQIDVDLMAKDTVNTTLAMSEVCRDVRSSSDDPISGVIRDIFTRDRADIEKALREGLEVAIRAAHEDPRHADAWMKIAASVKDLEQAFYGDAPVEQVGSMYGADIPVLHKLSLAIGGA